MMAKNDRKNRKNSLEMHAKLPALTGGPEDDGAQGTAPNCSSGKQAEKRGASSPFPLQTSLFRKLQQRCRIICPVVSPNGRAAASRIAACRTGRRRSTSTTSASREVVEVAEPECGH